MSNWLYKLSHKYNDFTSAMKAVKQNGEALRYASPELQNNPEIVMEAVKQYGGALLFASPELQNNPEIAMIAVKQYGEALLFASPELQNNPEIVMEAVKQYGGALIFASQELKNNPEIVMIAVKQDGNALLFASPELQNNPEIVMEAVKQYGGALVYASPELRNNLQIVMEAVKQYGETLEYASPELQNNPQFIAQFMNQRNQLYYHSNVRLHKVLPKLKLMITQLEQQINTQPVNKQQINDLRKQIKTLSGYPLESMKQLDALLQQSSNRPFSTKEHKWEYATGEDEMQHFNKKTEKVFAVYWDKALFSQLAQDPLLFKTIMHKPRMSHFSDITAPVGWALVYEHSPDTWVINQIQSDLFSDLHHIKQTILGTKQQTKQPISINELAVQLQANQRAGYISILQQPQYQILLTDLLNSPNHMNELPIATTEIEAQQHIHRLTERAQTLQNQGIISVDQTQQQLSQLTPQQIQYIYNKLGWLINGWWNLVFQNVWLNAKKSGVKHLYWNTPETVHSELSDDAKNIYYNIVPKNLGFEQKKNNLRGREESLWHREANNNWLSTLIAETDCLTKKGVVVDSSPGAKATESP